MRKFPRPVHLDLVAPPRRAPLAGAFLCAVGLAAAAAVGLAFQRALAERDRLEAALASTAQPRRRAAPSPEETRRAGEVAALERELAIPWTRLLAELEAAGADITPRVSLLAVEPDPVKRQVRITAEVRALTDALDYLDRLQQSEVLRNPVLESHDRRKDDPQRPLRVTLIAEWRS